MLHDQEAQNGNLVLSRHDSAARLHSVHVVSLVALHWLDFLL